MLTISATFDMHLLLPARIFVTLAYLVHIRIERCILHSSLIPRWIPDKVSAATSLSSSPTHSACLTDARVW
jgi:hypothetical protein